MASEYKSQKKKLEGELQQAADILLLGMRSRPYTRMDVERTASLYSIEDIYAAVIELEDKKLVSKYSGLNVTHGGADIFMLTKRGYKKAAEICEREQKNKNPLARRLIAKVLLKEVPDLSKEFDADTLAEMFGDKTFCRSLLNGLKAQSA